MVDVARVEAIFHDARAIESREARDAFVQDTCDGDDELRRRVDALLRAEDGAGAGAFLQTEDIGDAPAPVIEGPPPESLEGPGTVIDRYELVEQLGEGGFGVVFEAQQTRPMSRRVALKILKAGMDTRQILSRFEAERQAVAMMDHPNIARIFDAGATAAGRPYFVMELVEGTPITVFADEHGLSVRERIDLFRQVCAAVQHAHQKGVIHRDIKPSNVLVARVDDVPVPKVIDFGIAKATSNSGLERFTVTQAGLLVGTPQYMSPEQARFDDGDIDTRTDIYSLGILLYELLTGSTPIEAERLQEAGLGEIQKLIDEAETPRPSTRADRGAATNRFAVELRGDLDWIVLKALDRDRSRRYDTVHEFSEDLRRHLEDEPVAARPPSAAYRARKFVRKHRVAVVTMLLVTGTLVAGIIGTGTALVWALKTKSELEKTNVALDRTAGFQSQRLAEIVPENMGADLRQGIMDEVRRAMIERDEAPESIEQRSGQLRELLADANFTSLAVDSLDTGIFTPTLSAIDRLTDQPLVQASLLQSQAVALAELGLLDRAYELQERVIAIRTARLGPDHEQVLDSLYFMGVIAGESQRLDEAAEFVDRALEGRLAQLGEHHPETLESINSKGALLVRLQRNEEAEPFFQRALEGYRRLQTPDARPHIGTVRALGNLGALYRELGQYEKAEEYLRQSIDGYKQIGGREQLEALGVLHNLAILLDSVDRSDEGLDYARQAADGFRRVLGDDHPRTIMAVNGVARSLTALGRHDEALPYARVTLESSRRLRGNMNQETLLLIANMGIVLCNVEQYEEAERLGAESVHIARELGWGESEQTRYFLGAMLMEHGRTLGLMGRLEDGQAELMAAHDLLNATEGFQARHFGVQTMGLMSQLYEQWHEAAPDAGHDETARRWWAAAEAAATEAGVTLEP